MMLSRNYSMRREPSDSSISTTMTTTTTVTTTSSTASGGTTTYKEDGFVDEYNFDSTRGDDDDDDITIFGSNCTEIQQQSHLRTTGQQNLSRYDRRGRTDNSSNTKFRARLRRYLSSIGGERINTNMLPFGDTLLLMDASGRCNYRTKDGRFDIQISQDSKKKLSISTCVYSCGLENIASSMSVMKRALELNHGSRGDRHGFTLGIDPGVPNGNTEMPITLGITRSLMRMKRSDVMLILNNFIEIANNIRSKLEEADDGGRLGMVTSPFLNFKAPAHHQLKLTNVVAGSAKSQDSALPKTIGGPNMDSQDEKMKKNKKKSFPPSRRNSIVRTNKSNSLNGEKSFEKTVKLQLPPLDSRKVDCSSHCHDITDPRKVKEEFHKKWRKARKKSIIRTYGSQSLQPGQPRRIASMEQHHPSLTPWGVGMDNTPVISNRKCIHRLSLSEIQTTQQHLSVVEASESTGGGKQFEMGSYDELSYPSISADLEDGPIESSFENIEVYEDDSSTCSELVWV